MQKKRAAAALLAAAMILGVPAQAGSRGAFSDVLEKHWAFAAVEQAYADGVMTGTYYDAVTGVRQFSPEGSLSMAEWLSMLTRACWPEEVASAPSSGSWYAGAVAVAEYHGLLDGVEDVPLEGALTRNAMAVVIRHVLEEQGVAMPDEEALRDTQAKIGDWAQIPAQYQESVAAVMALGILSGTDSSGTFAGGATFTRAQAAAVYGRLEGVLTAGAGLPSQETTPEAEDPVAAVGVIHADDVLTAGVQIGENAPQHELSGKELPLKGRCAPHQQQRTPLGGDLIFVPPDGGGPVGLEPVDDGLQGSGHRVEVEGRGNNQIVTPLDGRIEILHLIFYGTARVGETVAAVPAGGDWGVIGPDHGDLAGQAQTEEFHQFGRAAPAAGGALQNYRFHGFNPPFSRSRAASSWRRKTERASSMRVRRPSSSTTSPSTSVVRTPAGLAL